MSMIGEVPYFLGLQITQSSKGLFISKKKYLKEISNGGFSPVSTPMIVGCKLRKYDISPDIDQRTYRSMIGELSFFLDLHIIQSSEGLFLSQEKYLKEMLKSFQMEYSSSISLPMVFGCKVSKDDPSADVVQRTYRSMMGSILYITPSRPDIM